jgi:RNA polymerase sigma-70 factor (ECF subfamily)
MRRIPHARHDPTGLLHAWAAGDADALARLIPVVEAELHRIAQRCMRNERAGHSMQATALVNEAYLRLVDVRRVQWKDRAHFLAMSARVMRRVLVDHARARGGQKRGGAGIRVTLVDDVGGTDERPHDVLALDDALTALAAIDPRKATIVEMKFFGGLTGEEVARLLEISTDTVTRDWTLAKAWLLRELRGSASAGG